jgi:hypothetical protein
MVGGSGGYLRTGDGVRRRQGWLEGRVCSLDWLGGQAEDSRRFTGLYLLLLGGRRSLVIIIVIVIFVFLSLWGRIYLKLRSHSISEKQPDGCHGFDDQGKDLIVFLSFSGETRYSRSPRYAPSRSKYRSDPSYLRSALTNFFIHTLTFCIGSCRLRDFLPSGPQIVSIVIYVGLFFTGTAEKSTSPVEEGCPWNANIFGANTQRS